MYPFLRLAAATAGARRAGPLPLFAVHTGRHRIWPWDLDPWAELNNGRTLTLYDLGRVPLVGRTGIAAALARQGWRMTVAGAAVRWRRRLVALQVVSMASRLIGWDARFLYFDQTLWAGADCAGQALIRTAATDPGRGGIIPPARLVAAIPGAAAESPALPGWVAAWAAAEAARPWPPPRTGL